MLSYLFATQDMKSEHAPGIFSRKRRDGTNKMIKVHVSFHATWYFYGVTDVAIHKTSLAHRPNSLHHQIC
jgi:hypothetical protein